MDSAVFQQLLELTQGFNKIGLKPVICGGLGLYLLFRDRPKDPEDIRTTTDIDLMIPSSQACNEVERNAIAELITEELQYVVREDGRHFRFIREQTHQLDILTPPTDGVVTEGGRVKLVRTKLHGRLTPEACFIGEDLRKVELAGPTFNPPQPSAVVNVPSPTNMLILKLFAFDDRDSDARRDDARAQAHAYDIYLIAWLSLPQDYREGREFLRRHETSDVVQRARTIVTTKFGALEQSGWRHVLTSTAFYPGRPLEMRRERLDVARRRLLRWFAE
jgi:hypothetical protein